MSKVRVLDNSQNVGWNVGDVIEVEGDTLDKYLDEGVVEHVDAEDQANYLKSKVEKKSPEPEAPKPVKDAYNQAQRTHFTNQSQKKGGDKRYER